MNSQVSKILLSLSEVDGRYAGVLHQKTEIEKKLQALGSEVSERRRRLAECEAASKDGKLRQVLEEHRLRDEESKIVERRKQLSSLGGAKAAKLMEREIDIASRALEVMEQQTMKAMEESQGLDTKLQELRERLEALELQYETERKDQEKGLTDLTKELSGVGSEREKMINQLEDRVRNLYTRVRSRYPGNAVAVANNGACRSCFRALPPQTYNQVLLGNALIQCPGCSRILVSPPPAK